MILRMLCVLMCVLPLSLFSASAFTQAPQLSEQRPRLVLAIVVDQFRYDYLTRFGPELEGGLKRLLDEGAVFTNANYEAAPTMTAVGHSTILSGATPSISGIAGNTWYERSEGRNVHSITDDGVTPLGGGNGASPQRLLVSTIGDELKLAGKGGKVFGVSLKDRSAILPVGRSADGAFWIVDGAFVSSSWYFPALPEWVSAFNAAKPADQFAGKQWLTLQLPAEPGVALYGALDATPFSDQMVLDFALRLMSEEQLGKDAQTDLLSVSFSAMDYVGHATGTETPQMRDMVLTVDQRIGELLAAAERQAGRGNVLVVFTADHGVATMPEDNIAKQLPGGRYSVQEERAAVETALSTAFGAGTWIEGSGELGLYLHGDPVPGKVIGRAEMENVAAAALRRLPEVARVYTRTQLESAPTTGDVIDQRIRNGFSAGHSGDVIIVHQPNWLGEGRGTTHGSPYAYDTHVPVIFWGPESLLTPGQYHGAAAVHDIAATLATLLGVAQPSGSIGRTLAEILP